MRSFRETDYDYTEDQKSLKELVSQFAENEIGPFIEDEENAETPDVQRIKDLVRKMGEIGLTGLTAPTDKGGAGLGALEFAMALEEIAKVSLSHSTTLAVTALPLSILLEFGSEKQRDQYLEPLITGECVGSFALSEAGSGSDAAALKTTAKKEGKEWVLNGTKLWITNAPAAGVFVVMARSNDQKGHKGISAFLINGDNPGLRVSKTEKKLGLRGSPTCEIVLENCRLPESALIGGEGQGFKIALAALDSGRISIGATSCGLAQAALTYALNYAQDREQFGKAIYHFQGIQWMFADMATELEASRLMVYEAAKLKDDGKPFTRLSSMAKLKASEMAMKVTTDAVQILGGVGYTKEYPVERYMRDAKVLQIVEGTSQVQKIVIARDLVKESL
jgi:alkylation response protein AidB-like acyl-CoA dehydrogenase